MRKKMTYVEAIDVAIASVQNEAAVERLQTLRDTLVKVGEKQRSSSAQRLAKKRDENTQIIEKAFAKMEAGVAYFTSDICALVPELNGATPQKITSMMRLLGDKVVATKSKGKTSYTIA